MQKANYLYSSSTRCTRVLSPRVVPVFYTKIGDKPEIASEEEA